MGAEHVGFGMVLGPDGKPFKTREGKAMRLADAARRRREQTSPPVALAAVKYADLSTGINKDYVFDIDRMVQTTGNTGPYLQYAHARLAQVLRRAEAEGLADQTKITVLDEPAEQTLALVLTRFGEVVPRWPRRCSRTGSAATCTSWPAPCRSSTSSARC